MVVCLPMTRNEQIAIEILDEIDRARSGSLKLDELETKLWRLLDATDEGFPHYIAGLVENLVVNIQQLQRENIFWMSQPADENRGIETIFNEVTGAISQYLR